MLIDRLFIFLGMIFAVGSGVYLLYEAFRKKSGLDKYGKYLYVLLGVVNIYTGIIYLFALVGILGIPGYGAWVRPVLVPILAGDGFVAFYHRGGKNDDR